MFAAGGGWVMLLKMDSNLEKTAWMLDEHLATAGHPVALERTASIYERMARIEGKVDTVSMNQAAICQALNATCK